jgi:hypothetical protein
MSELASGLQTLMDLDHRWTLQIWRLCSTYSVGGLTSTCMSNDIHLRLEVESHPQLRSL